MIMTCTPSGPERLRLIQHEFLVVLEFDKYCNRLANDLYAIWSSNARLIQHELLVVLEFDKYCN